MGYPLDFGRSSAPAPGAPKNSRGFGQRLGPRLSEKALATSATNTQLISGALRVTRNGAELGWLWDRLRSDGCVFSMSWWLYVLMFKDIDLYMV